jgi:hypothetical protein
MKKTNSNATLKFEDIPAGYKYCFQAACPLHGDCMRFKASEVVPSDKTWGTSVFPTALKNGHCDFFQEIKTLHLAYGFDALFANIKGKDVKELRAEVQQYLGARSNYYRYNSGEYKLKLAQQAYILGLFSNFGYTEGMHFDAYEDRFEME